tara:strand:+ start:256 stop:843 length:588 start_codon:yes stop_codon:yes gene_type:complete
MKKIDTILASNSPRRKKILSQIGIRFKIISSLVNEHSNLSCSPNKFAEYWSIEKTKKVSEIFKDYITIGADTIVCIDNEILGKPKNKKDSIKMLKKLSGNTHKVITGVSIACYKENIFKTFSETTEVVVRNISNNQINYYVNNYKTLDKAGSYGIQDFFSIWIEKINGCYYNVMGLPVSKFYYNYNLIKNKLLNK